MFAITFEKFSSRYNPNNTCCFFKIGKSMKSLVVQGDPKIWNTASPFNEVFYDWDIKVKI